MHIVPAIFIQSGKVVSWYKGNDNAEKKIYNIAPHNLAELFAKQGAKSLFVVDLDGDQQERLKLIKEHFSGEIWWAGQVRSLEKIQWLLNNGASRIVLGQSAKPIHRQALEKYGSQTLMAGIQTKHYQEVPDLCEAIGGSGFTDVIVKDLNAEGTLFQPNYDLMEKCVYFSTMNVYASGGVTSRRDIDLLAKAGVKGVIIARALYENELSLNSLLND